jgi:arginase
MRVEVIAVPYDSARRGERMGAGPEHLLRAGLEDHLTRAGHSVWVRMLEAPADHWRAEIRTAFDLARAVSGAVSEALADGAFPLVLSGNCGPAALGCLSALRRPSVFWFDAHGDFNTPETTIGGFLDGMALATVAGRCWHQLAAALPGFHPVPERSIALIGARDLDPLEAALLERSAIRRIAGARLRRDLPTVLAASEASAPTYLHLDLDVLDPREARVNPYAAPDGLSRADVAWAITAIAQSVPLGAAALTAYDPGSDAEGTGCETALALAVALVPGKPRATATPPGRAREPE